MQKKSVVLCAVAAFLALVYSGAYAVVTSISTIALYISYVLPVWLHLRAGSTLARGPWHLGRWSRAVNVIALLWVLFLCIVLSIPDNQRAGKSLGAVTILLAVWYLLGERNRFTGPQWAAEEKRENHG